jgi:ribulose-5-phosphate 4-epimerase/fuculose-1-phosphate aldolase
MNDYESPLGRSIRESIALACRLMIDRELKPSHVSARVPGSDLILVRTRGGGTTSDHVVLVDADGARIAGGGDPPIELPLHTEIYRRRPDVRAVLHTHQPQAVRLGDRAAGDPTNEIPVYPHSDQITTVERGRDVAQLLADGTAVHLWRHGMAFAGTSIEAVVDLAIALEETAARSLTTA